MQIVFSEVVDKELRKIHKKDQRLAKQIEKQLSLFIENPKHPSLRLHKLSADLNGMWSISINMSIRMVYILDNNTAYFINIGNHDEVYRK